MAHFAKINESNEVLSVLYVNDVDTENSEGIETESVGQTHLETHNNWPAQMWIQTSYNTSGGQHRDGGTPFRGNYASIGFIWDEDNEIFWPPKPFSSWVKNISEARWQSPIGDAPVLTETQQSQKDNNTNDWYYMWDEVNQTWDLTDLNT
tara:strand:- start:202 stop:651 length:450 start_codon:yes stop_codon:yes gene_type:complete